MGTSDWALIICLSSRLPSLARLIWNVWSKFVFHKACVAVTFEVMLVIGSDPSQRFLSLDVTNFSPGKVRISCAVARPRAAEWACEIRDQCPAQKVADTLTFLDWAPRKQVPDDDYRVQR